MTPLRETAARLAALALAALVLALALAAPAARAQQPDPRQILADAKAATGGAAWDALRSQHTRVTMKVGSVSGTVERWASLTTGRSLMRYEIGAASGVQGFDGISAWAEDAAGHVRVESDPDMRELAANAAYRDRLAFWFPERQPARIDYARRDVADGIDYDVIRIVPDGGRAYEVWVGMLTHRVERLVEPEGAATRTEIYSDFRSVQGVTLPFHVRATRGDPKQDEEYRIEAIEYNVPLDDVDFGVPPPPPEDVVFVPAKDSVDVPFEVRNGHVFVQAMLNGKGPFRMLFDAGGASVLLPSTVRALGLGMPRASAATRGAPVVGLDRVELSGVAFERQTFAVLDLAAVMRKVEGLDDVAGVVGFDVVTRLPTRIAYADAKLTLWRPRAFHPPRDAARVPFAWHERVPQVQASVDGVEGAFDVDTGSRASLTLSAPFVERNGLVAKYGATHDVVAGAGAGGHAHALLARAGKLAIGGVDVDAPVTYLSTATSGALADPALAGDIGYGVLRRFDVTFDCARRVLYFAKNASFGEPDVQDRAGLWLERGERGFDVVDVVRDGPAAAAGLRAGDVIVAVDGKPAKSLSLADVRALLRGAPGTHVRLTPARKGAKQAIVVLRDLV